MDYTKSRGNITELQCMSKFMEFGFDCSVPYGDGAKYDFIADVNGKLIRVQCKTCKNVLLKNGERDANAITFSTVCQTTNTKKTVRHKYSKQEIDYFATSFNEKVYLVPVEECSTSKTLRFSPPQTNNQRYNKAEDYEFETIFAEELDFNFFPQEKPVKIFYCRSCGKEQVGASGVQCLTCVAIANRKVERPSRQELKQMIREKPFLEIGRLYGVSDNAIRKWCKAENLPTRKQDINLISNEEWELI